MKKQGRCTPGFPYYIVQCNHCLREWPIHLFRTLFLYVQGRKTVAVAKRSIGWCYRCSRPTVVEGHGSQAAVERELSGVRAMRSEAKGAGMARVVNSLRRVLDPDYAEEIDLLKTKEILLGRLAWALRARVSAPRCFSCSSTSLVSLDGWERDDSPTETCHPGCGGHLRVLEGGFDCPTEELVSVLSIEGLPVAVQPDARAVLQP